MGWEEQFKIIGKPVSLSSERGAHKADFESLFLFSDMNLDFCGTLLSKPGHCFKFKSTQQYQNFPATELQLCVNSANGN